MESENSINEGIGCKLCLLNKSGISLKKDELECKLLSFNLSEDCSSSELNKILKIVKDEFKIPWAIQKFSSYNKSINGIKINKINDIDFVDISFNNSTKIALVNISDQRSYNFKAELEDKLGNNKRNRSCTEI